MRTLLQRFNAKWKLNPDTGCWIWTAAANWQGYGTIGTNVSRAEYAHRVSYKLHVGDIPDGMLVRHGPCHNRLCVNPEHLELGTSEDNTLDRIRDRTNPTVLTEAQVISIRKNYSPVRGALNTLARKYGVSHTTIRDVINRTTWKHLE